MMMMISVKLASIAVILLGLLPTLSVAAIRGAGNQQEQQQKTTTTTTTTLHDHRKLVVGDGSTPALCTTDGSVVVAAIATGANVVVYLCDGFFFQPTLSMGLINDSQKVRIVCMGTCKIDGGLKPNALPREVFEVRTGGVLQMYGVDIENFASVRKRGSCSCCIECAYDAPFLAFAI